MDVANQRVPLGAKFFHPLRKSFEELRGFCRIANTIGAHIDDRGARPDPIGLHVSGAAHGRHDDVRVAQHSGKIARLRVTDRHRGIGMHQKQRHRLSNDVAAAQHHCVRAFNRNIVAAQYFHASRRSARHQAGAPAHQRAKADRMKPIHIFRRIDRFQHALGVHLFGQGKLDQDAVDIVVVV
jgi:hypothetical protein